MARGGAARRPLAVGAEPAPVQVDGAAYAEADGGAAVAELAELHGEQHGVAAGVCGAGEERARGSGVQSCAPVREGLAH